MKSRLKELHSEKPSGDIYARRLFPADRARKRLREKS